ncbi:MAG TPA: DUF488 domain-containing protein [Rhizomicrobium sp.]|jgi:uncharacterized protein YeaO (DUF488 family)|nr:DUF488 domain-containing protein [Rhizomicrobium sp.]
MVKRKPDIQVKRVYEPPEEDDGARVLVDRLWPRGLKKECAALTLWLKEIAPSEELRKWFGHDPERWTEFVHRYRAELAHNAPALARMRELAKEGRVTLLYAAHDGEHNNAVALAAYLQDYPEEERGRMPR